LFKAAALQSDTAVHASYAVSGIKPVSDREILNKYLSPVADTAYIHTLHYIPWIQS
jgi:hypothetical protein